MWELAARTLAHVQPQAACGSFRADKDKDSYSVPGAGADQLGRTPAKGASALGWGRCGSWGFEKVYFATIPSLGKSHWG